MFHTFFVCFPEGKSSEIIRDHEHIIDTYYRMGPQDSCQISGFMVDISIVNGAYFMVYKPTTISGGPILIIR